MKLQVGSELNIIRSVVTVLTTCSNLKGLNGGLLHSVFMVFLWLGI